MSQTPEVELLREAGQLAKRQLLDLAEAMYGVVMGSDGETFGDQQMSRSDRILRIVMAARDGTLDVLAAQSPRIYLLSMRQYVRDIQAELEAAQKVKQPQQVRPFNMAEAMTVAVEQAPRAQAIQQQMAA